MRKNAQWTLIVVLAVVITLLATDTVSVQCNAKEDGFIESVEDAGEDLEDAARELTD